MTRAKLKDLKSLSDVAFACGVSLAFIEEYANDGRQRSHFTLIKIPKRRQENKYRLVFSANHHEMSAFHRSIAMLVASSVDFGEHVQGFLKKRSARRNAEQHLGAKILLHADIKDFFDAITTEQVQVAFVTEGLVPSVASVLAKACTIDGLLRQGTRCSPILANLVCADLDRKFLSLARSHGAVYTRYADDLTFSGDDVPTDDAVREILRSEGFILRENKCRRQARGRSQYVTGLTVSDSSHPRLPKKLKSRLRLIFHYIETYGLSEHWARTRVENSSRKEAWLEGVLWYAASIEPELVNKWEQILREAKLKRQGTKATFNSSGP